MRDHADRWAWAEVDLDAIAANVELLRTVVAPAGVWAVVKADGYGHGAVPVARAALGAGAGGLCVALTSEAVVLRRAGISPPAPILVLSEQPADAAPTIVANDLTPTVYTATGIDALAKASAEAGRVLGVHIKVDTGMHRVGAAPPEIAELVARVERSPGLRLDGLFTHLAVADEPLRPDTDGKLARFDAVLAAIPTAPDAVHAANSAGALAHPAARRSFVRAGIAVYGISPGAAVDPLAAGLRPALSLKARVSYVKRVAAGEALSYGLRHTFAAEATVATVPIGYADGVRRNLSGTATPVLIGGRRRTIVGTITMDQLMVDCGDDEVAVGDEVVLIGAQGGDRIRAEDWATTLGTIGYEIVCGIGARVPRCYVGG